MEGNTDNAETLYSSTSNVNQVLMVVSNDGEASVLKDSVTENLANGAQVMDSTTYKSHCEDGHTFMESTIYVSEAVNEETVSGNHGFAVSETHAIDEKIVNDSHDFTGNATNEADASEENAIDGNCGFVNSHDFTRNANNEADASEGNAIDGNCGFVNNFVDEVHTFVETSTISAHSVVEKIAKQNCAFEEHTVQMVHSFEKNDSDGINSFAESSSSETHVFVENCNNETHDFVENCSSETNTFLENANSETRTFEENHSIENHTYVETISKETHPSAGNTDNVTLAVEDTKDDKTIEIVNTVSDDSQFLMKTASSEDHKFTNDVNVEQQILKEDIVEHIEESVTTNMSEEDEAFLGKSTFGEHSSVGSSIALVEDSSGKKSLDKVTDGKYKIPKNKFEFDLKCYGPVMGRRSYRSDLSNPTLPAQIIFSESRRQTEAPCMTHGKLEKVSEQNDSVGTRKRRLEEITPPAQAAKRKKLFPFSLFSYLSYLSPFSLLSTLRRTSQDVAVADTLLTDESEESD